MITDIVTGTWPYPMSVRVADRIVSVPGVAAVRFSVSFQYQGQSHGKRAIII